MPDYSKCKTCGAPIEWVGLDGPKGPRPHPIDVEPETPMRIVRYGPNGRYAKHTRTWTSHFATCPDADQHRRGDDS